MDSSLSPTPLIGKTFVPSTTQEVAVVVTDRSAHSALKNQMIHLDVVTDDGTTSRAFGFVNEITTLNSHPNPTLYLRAEESNMEMGLSSGEFRTFPMKVASTFSKREDGSWSGGAPMPTSPSLGTPVRLVSKNLIDGLFTTEQMSLFTYLGGMRGAGDLSAPLLLPYFGSKRGASSSAFLGKTGSGKTSFTTGVLINQMRHRDHAIIVVDPQGQWNSENGFVYSPQQVAEALGRKVHKIRVGEDIRLDLTEDNFSNMLAIVDVFARIGRMAKENRDLLAQEVGDIIVHRGYRYLNKDHKELLSEVFRIVCESDSTLKRIYASEDKQMQLRDSLLELVADEKYHVQQFIISHPEDFGVYEVDAIDPEVYERALIAYRQAGGEPDENEKRSVEERWKKILSKFSPVLNLFMTSNIAGEVRTPLGGSRGILTDILKVRGDGDEPAPYVILDMSPDVKNKAKGELLSASDNEKALEEANMRRLLDNDTVKASILKIIFAELKEASEEAFADGGGNLNTQIVFDEAWRYAPNSSDDEVIMDLSKQLEGFALDTRKFGIGWTYILQSPTDLRDGIWRQLKYVYAGYGLVGADLKKLADLTDDPNTQLANYKQFTSPDLTGEYPFMIMGSVSPLITAQIPLFLNSYTTVDEFYENNKTWMDAAAKKEGRPSITPRIIDASASLRVKSKTPTSGATFSVGGTEAGVSKPKSVEKKSQDYEAPKGAYAPPF